MGNGPFQCFNPSSVLHTACKLEHCAQRLNLTANQPSLLVLAALVPEFTLGFEYEYEAPQARRPTPGSIYDRPDRLNYLPDRNQSAVIPLKNSLVFTALPECLQRLCAWQVPPCVLP